jgi:hypothetical protein
VEEERVMSYIEVVNVKLPLTDPKAQRGVEVQIYSFLATALEGCGWSDPHAPGALPPGKAQYPLYRRLGGPQAGLDV